MVFISQYYDNILLYLNNFFFVEEKVAFLTAVISPNTGKEKFYSKFDPGARLTVRNTGYMKIKGQDDLDHPALAVSIGPPFKYEKFYIV